MKKLLTFIVGSALGLGAYAQSFDSDNLYYEVLSPDDKTCAVTGYYGLPWGAVLEIPESVDYDGVEYSVTGIGENAFFNCNQLNEVVIPNSVKEIGRYSFAYSYSLKKLVLGSSVDMIYSQAFVDCPLEYVVALGETPARFEYDYQNVFTSNPYVAVKENCVDAYKAAWEGANVVPNLPAESISFDPESYSVQPGGTVQINCLVSPANALVKYSTDNKDIISVDDNGLVTADKLRGGYTVFVTASTLNGLTATCQIEVASLEQFSLDGYSFAIIPDTENEVAIMEYRSDDAVVEIPTSVEYNGNTYTVTTIAPYAFNWKDMEEVVIPASLTSIRENNFQSCRSLKKVTIADSDTPLHLSNNNFTSNESLSEVYVGRSLTSPEDAITFYWNDKLTRLVLGPKVTSLSSKVFNQCWNLNLIESKNPVPPVIGDYTFGRDSLTIIVPLGSVEAYQNAWENYASYISAAVDAESISFEEEEVTIYQNQYVKLPLTVDPEGAQVIWNSSDRNIVAVNQEGYVWMNNVGEAVITATSINGLTAECKVTSKNWLTFSKNSVNMEPGDTYEDVVTKPEVLADAEISWWSDDESVATVDENGKITAVSFGDTYINANVYVPDYGWYTYRIEVKVHSVPTSVSVENPEVTVFKDYGTDFNVVIEPQDDEYLNREITWTVADPEIAEIEGDWYSNTTYRVIGKEVGKTTLTGTTVNGLSVEVEVDVLPVIQSITFANNATYMTEGQTRKLEFTTDPEETGQTYTYTSSDENVVTIDENGVMTAQGLGRAWVYVEYKTPWGSNSRSRHEVNVVIAPENVQFIDGISNFEGNLQYSTYIGVEFTPDDNEVSKHIDWTVEDPEIGYIDSYDWGNSYFTGQKFGTTTFRGVAVNGQVLEGTITIAGLNVLEDGYRIWTKEMLVGEEFKFDVEASSAELLANVTVESLNTEVATVSEDGTVTAVGYGQAAIYVRSWEETANGRKDYSYSFNIIVRPEEGFVFSTSKVTMPCWNEEYIEIITAPNLSVWNLDLNWESSDENVAYIGWGSNYCAYIYSSNPGYSTISAIDQNGNGSASCDVTCFGVEMAEGYIVMDTNSTYQLVANILPEVEGVELQWESYNPDVVTVDENGLLTSYGEIGDTNVVVHAIVNGREMSAWCWVEVYPQVTIPVEKIEIENPIINAVPGEVVQLDVTVYPLDATNKGLYYESDDESVATVDSNGLVYIHSYGIAGIKVYSLDNWNITAMAVVSGGATGVDALFNDGECDIYQLNGIVLKKGATTEDYKQLAPGIYLIKKGDKMIKIKR